MSYVIPSASLLSWRTAGAKPVRSLRPRSQSFNQRIYGDRPRGRGNPPEPETPYRDPLLPDFTKLANALRKQGKSRQAELVEFMADRTVATIEEVAENVHSNVEAGDEAIRANVKRTNDSLAELGVIVLFRVACGRVFRESRRCPEVT